MPSKHDDSTDDDDEAQTMSAKRFSERRGPGKMTQARKAALLNMTPGGKAALHRQDVTKAVKQLRALSEQLKSPARFSEKQIRVWFVSRRQELLGMTPLGKAILAREAKGK